MEGVCKANIQSLLNSHYQIKRMMDSTQDIINRLSRDSNINVQQKGELEVILFNVTEYQRLISKIIIESICLYTKTD